MANQMTPEEEGALLKSLFGGRNKAQFARDYKVPGGPSMISQHMSGHRPINLGAATAYANGLGVSVEAFSPRLAKEIEMANLAQGGSPVASLSPAPAPGAPSIQVPLLANAGSMGTGTDVEHDDVMIGAIALSPDWIAKRVRPTTPEALRFIHAYGDSMSPTMEDGDVALVDTGRRDPSGADGVYVLATEKRVFIKRVTERFNGGHDVTSDNPTVKTVQALNGNGEIRVLGKVVWVWNGRKI